MEYCDTCSSQLIEKNWKIDFFIESRFVSILNYPILLCPKCASMKFAKDINSRVLKKIHEKTHTRSTHPSAIKFEEHF